MKKHKSEQRGITVIFKIICSNHIRLSEMADRKSHIMISVNSIILSVVISVLLKRFEQSPNLVIPTILLLFVNVSALIFAVLATRPQIHDRIMSADGHTKRKVDLLFFGSFYTMKVDRYVSSMFRMMKNSETLYTSLMQDIHAQASVLARKYNLLRISYTIFMYGIIAATLAFIFATVPAFKF